MSDRITRIEGMCDGQPCIRGMRIRVVDICSMIVQDVTNEEILKDFPDLEPEDIEACLDFDWIDEP
jgi:uncharacterized protein (DUF433 family)